MVNVERDRQKWQKFPSKLALEPVVHGEGFRTHTLYWYAAPLSFPPSRAPRTGQTPPSIARSRFATVCSTPYTGFTSGRHSADEMTRPAMWSKWPWVIRKHLCAGPTSAFASPNCAQGECS